MQQVAPGPGGHHGRLISVLSAKRAWLRIRYNWTGLHFALGYRGHRASRRLSSPAVAA